MMMITGITRITTNLKHSEEDTPVAEVGLLWALPVPATACCCCVDDEPKKAFTMESMRVGGGTRRHTASVCNDVKQQHTISQKRTSWPSARIADNTLPPSHAAPHPLCISSPARSLERLVLSWLRRRRPCRQAACVQPPLPSTCLPATRAAATLCGQKHLSHGLPQPRCNETHL